MIAELPWPPRILSPNGRGHHMALHAAKKKARRIGGEAVIAAGRPRFPKDTPLAVTLTFHPKTRTAPDEDNAIASLKAYLDGIATALGVDDKLFRLQRPIMADPVKGGRVLVSIEIAQ
ncbi:hypothetical protein ACNFJ7_02120 [Sphingomonas sp. HT-1]|uniref:hypothetical protein n=1 Tax=unclassified Sphingomonas TaxID=196159 RepID=UPI00047464FD|nr:MULTISPECIES: hypothetical protein [unclassified Sphingomonas]